MKRRSKILLFLLLAVLPITLFAQNPVVIAAYMRVAQGAEADYLEVEQAWKKVHQKGVELGVYNGWQLYRKLHASYDDPYQYITLHWYNDHAHSFGEDAPVGWMNDVYSEAEWDALMEKTFGSRVYAYEKASHLVVTVDNPGEVNYLLIYGMRVKPGMEEEYEKMEIEIFKPYHEELIRRDYMTYWGIWHIWPHEEGEITYRAVQGYDSVEQLTKEGVVINPEELGLNVLMDEVIELVRATRDMVSSEIWVLVDEVWAEEE